MMSERNIRGVGICFGEHLDDKGYYRCSRCNSKTILVTVNGDWGVDEEAFKSGEQKPEGTPDVVYVGEVSGHYCLECEMLVSLDYNFK
ncbi:MAG: hypothetical protein ACYS1A_17420 [Planctomycetota bacterium]|jgi:hypothetical protein